MKRTVVIIASIVGIVMGAGVWINGKFDSLNKKMSAIGLQIKEGKKL